VSGLLGGLDRQLLENAEQIIGVDEVGRGSLAGPVVVAGVGWRVIPDESGIRDSKRLTGRQREKAAVWVKETCSRWLVVEIWPDLIDRLNILGATRLAMRAITTSLVEEGSVVVVDAVDLGDPRLPARSEIRADGRYFSVASASIVAKVYRDRLMERCARSYGLWAWERNKGYGTKEHRAALDVHGRSFMHRRSFNWRPVLP